MYYVECEGLQVYWFIHQSSVSLHRALRAWMPPVRACVRVCACACGQWEGKAGMCRAAGRLARSLCASQPLDASPSLSRRKYWRKCGNLQNKPRLRESRKCLCSPWRHKGTWRLPARGLDNLPAGECVCVATVKKFFFSMKDSLPLRRGSLDSSRQITWQRTFSSGHQQVAVEIFRLWKSPMAEDYEQSAAAEFIQGKSHVP